jgi:ribose/xylose/arabinose/galactoside ABC-type transport system permease subunit
MYTTTFFTTRSILTFPQNGTQAIFSSPFFELKQTRAFSITHYNAMLFVTSILIGWRLNFHDINSTVDAIGETTQAQT